MHRLLSRPSRLALALLTALLYAVSTSATLSAADKKILFIAGPPSHGSGYHEYNAGLLLFQKCLAGIPGLKTEISLNGWPKDPAALTGVDAIMTYCDGGGAHLALQDDHLALLDAAMARGVGLGVIHYATEPTPEKGQAEFLRWIGAAFEPNWSVNPVWTPHFAPLPTHPITRGVQPLTLRDEWYFHLRFAPDLKGVTPLLVAVPDTSVLTRRDGDHSGNPAMRAAVARGDTQVLSWAFERPDGGRGFGYTGGHHHRNWADENSRKLILNALLWLAKMEVPQAGVTSTVSPADLLAHLDPKPDLPNPPALPPLPVEPRPRPGPKD